MKEMNTLASAGVTVPVRQGRASRVSPARPESEGRRVQIERVSVRVLCEIDNRGCERGYSGGGMSVR